MMRSASSLDKLAFALLLAFLFLIDVSIAGCYVLLTLILLLGILHLLRGENFPACLFSVIFSPRTFYSPCWPRFFPLTGRPVCATTKNC